MNQPTSADDAGFEEDPVYRHAAREARFILALWLCCFLYTVGYCYLNGYLSHEPLPSSTGPDVAQVVGPLESFNRDPDSVSYPLGLGIPDWVFYGVALPWVVCIAVTCWYALAFFAEDDLSDGTAEAEGGGQ